MEVPQSINAVRYSSKPQSTTLPAKVTTTAQVTTAKSMTAKKPATPVNTHYYKNTSTNGRMVAHFLQDKEEIYEDMDRCETDSLYN